MPAKWCRQDLRLAIMIRDDFLCGYCGANVEDGASLTLDHIVARINGGSNKPSNLITCCSKCNVEKLDKPLTTFLFEKFDNWNIVTMILKRAFVQTKLGIKPFRAQAKKMLANRSIAEFTGNQKFAEIGARNGNGLES